MTRSNGGVTHTHTYISLRSLENNHHYHYREDCAADIIYFSARDGKPRSWVWKWDLKVDDWFNWTSPPSSESWLPGSQSLLPNGCWWLLYSTSNIFCVLAWFPNALLPPFHPSLSLSPLLYAALCWLLNFNGFTNPDPMYPNVWKTKERERDDEETDWSTLTKWFEMWNGFFMLIFSRHVVFQQCVHACSIVHVLIALKINS